jgi:hypothetical protein
MDAPAKPTTTALPDPFITTGPALFYVTTQQADATQSVQRIDLDYTGDPRERAICRALLHHALALLDASEPARRAPSGPVEGRRI